MSEKPPRPVNPVEDTSSTVPPTESTPETPKPAGAETGPVPPVEAVTASQAAQEKTPKAKKISRPEEAFFEEFLNKRGRGLFDAQRYLVELRVNIELGRVNVEESKKAKCLDKLSEVEKVVDSLMSKGKKTPYHQRAKAERALKFLHDAGAIDFPTMTEEADVAEEVVASQPDTANGPTEPPETEPVVEESEPVRDSEPTKTEEPSGSPKEEVPPVNRATGASDAKKKTTTAGPTASGKAESAKKKGPDKAPEPPDVFEPLPSTDPSDWEAILGVSPGATKEELRNAYRRLSQKYHPDKRNGHPQQQQFEEAFKVVNAAYANAQGKGKKSRYAPPPPSSSSGSTQAGGHTGGHGAPPPPSGAGRGPRAAGGGTGGPTGAPPPPGAGGPTPSGAPKATRGPGKPKTPGAEEFKVFSEKFKSDLKISEKDLKTIPGYEDLTFGQRALVQERFKQVMLGKIREDANSQRKEQQANAGRLGKFVGEFLKTRRIAELEKAVAGKLSEGGIDMHRATLEQLVAATKANKDEATLDKEGDLNVLNISYTSGLKAENPVQARQAALFDEAASKLSQIPSEWGAESATRAQKAEYEKTKKEYDTLRARVLFMKQAQTGNDVESMLWMNGVDERVRFDQLISTSPKVAEEMQSIQNPKLWTKIIQNVGGTERLGYFVGGGVTRALTVSLFGMAGAPILAGLIGGWQARKRAQGALRESDQLARRGVKDTKATALNMLDVTKNKTAAKLEKLAQQVVQETDPAERGKLIASLRERIKYTQEKLESGKLNFGTFSERIKNQLDLSQALGHASVVAFENAADTDADHEARLSKELDQYLDSHQGAIAGERADAVWEATKKGAKISAGFALAGYLVSNFMHGGNTVDGLFDSKTADVAHQGAGGGIPDIPEQGGGGSVSDIISAQESAQNHPGVTELVAGGGKSAEGAVTTLEIGNRGPEGSVIDYFKDHQDIAKKFGWDGNGDIKKWAGTKAHALWLEHASKALENDEVKESLAKLGYTNDLEGYTKMMTRIKSGGVALDIQHKGITLSGMEYLEAKAGAPVKLEAIERMDFEQQPIERMDFEPAPGDFETAPEAVEGVDDSQLWKKRGVVLHDSPVEPDNHAEVDDHQLWKTKEPVLHAPLVEEGAPAGESWQGQESVLHEQPSFDENHFDNINWGDDGLGLGGPQGAIEGNLSRIFNLDDITEYGKWLSLRDFGARRLQGLFVDKGSVEQGLQSYVNYLERTSGLHPRGGIFRRNETVYEFISRATEKMFDGKK